MGQKHRWPSSIHSQIEAVFHSVRSIREKKPETSNGIRSFGSWKVYLYESHRFGEFLCQVGLDSILDTGGVEKGMAEYLEMRLQEYALLKRSHQTMETTLSAMGKFQYALNFYIETHLSGGLLLDIESLRQDYYARSRKLLGKSSRVYGIRAYPDPIRLIAAINDGTFQLQAALQYEGGLRAEGVGAPSNQRLRNPLTRSSLRGTCNDPVTGKIVGIVAAREKGGKETDHYVSLATYQRLEEYIDRHGMLQSVYADYVAAVNLAAKETGQYALGRGSHALKHSFAQERYFECVSHGMTHEQALQQTSLETSHYRLKETLTYTRG